MLYIYFENVVFQEIAYELKSFFQEKQIAVRLTSEIEIDNYLDLYIILGMNDFSSPIVPNNYIVYQLEQTTGNDESKWFNSTYLNYLKNALAVWDYSLINYQNLRKLEIKNVDYVPLQYMRTVDKINHKPNNEKDIDIFFYGSFNERRLKILESLKQKGMKVIFKNNIWKAEREDLISRSKILLNIHYFEHSILETVRLSYLLSNNCNIISEVSQDPILDKWHKSYIEFAKYEELVDVCCKAISKWNSVDIQNEHLKEYKLQNYHSKIPFDKIKSLYGYLINDSQDRQDRQESASKPSVDMDLDPLPINNSDLFEAESDITKDKELILKLPKFSYNELPYVSIITVTYNRKDIFPLAIRNWELFQYPKDKLEWIIVDDSDDGSNLSELLPKSQQIKYYKLQTTGRLLIGQKRNFGVEQATHDYIAFMDDDDYYYPLSIYARIGVLLKYPQFDLVGVCNLDIYDVANDFCAKINGPYISEASMAFRKKFWQNKKFPEKFNTLGEGYPFTKGRRQQIVTMPSCFNLIALTHWNNYTQTNRSYQKFSHVEKKHSLLKILDLQTRLFIFDLFDRVKMNIKLPAKNQIEQT